MRASASSSPTRRSKRSTRTTRPAAVSLRRSKGTDMALLAPAVEAPRSTKMDNVARLDADTAWAAFMRRDRAWDGRILGAVKTTGIYCKPSCPAKRPKREHVEFFATGEEARAAGYRSCLRCKPDEVGRDRDAVAKAVKLIK